MGFLRRSKKYNVPGSEKRDPNKFAVPQEHYGGTTTKRGLQENTKARLREVVNTETGARSLVEVYTISESAKVLGIGRATLYRWREAGIILPPVLCRASHPSTTLYAKEEVMALRSVLDIHKINRDHVEPETTTANLLKESQITYRQSLIRR